jgi:hypothetical protein
MRILKGITRVLSIGLFLTATSCSPEPVTGRFEFQVKDHREAIDDFSSVDVAIDSIRLRSAAGWMDLKPAVASIDLTRYTEGNSVTLFDDQISSRSIDGVNLHISAIDGTLKKNNHGAEVKNALGPIQLQFALKKDAPTLLVFDLKVMDLSDHPGHGYELHLNGYELFQGGKLIDKVPPG